MSVSATQEGQVDISATAAATSLEAGLGSRTSAMLSASAMTATATAALTVYDMCKASSKSMVIKDLSTVVHS